MTLRIRDRIRSVAGAFDEADGRPFVLGKAMRVPRRTGLVRNDGRTVISHGGRVTALRIWLACVDEVFEVRP